MRVFEYYIVRENKCDWFVTGALRFVYS